MVDGFGAGTISTGVRKEIELNGNLILKTIYWAFGLAAIRYWVNKLQWSYYGKWKVYEAARFFSSFLP